MNKLLLDFFQKSIWSLKLTFMAALSENFSTICQHMLSKFCNKSAQKFLIFSTKATFKRSLLLAPMFLLLAADEPVCKKCQMIREYNAAHPENNYEYYDDYIRDLEKKKKAGEAAKDPKELGYKPK